MRSKAPLAMMEQMIMLLVFALAAALCLQAFVLADQSSQSNTRRDEALTQVQQVAEVVKYCGGDLEQAAAQLGGSLQEDRLTLACENGEITVTPEQSEHALLGTARVEMTDEAGRSLFSLRVTWQTGGGR